MLQGLVIPEVGVRRYFGSWRGVGVTDKEPCGGVRYLLWGEPGRGGGGGFCFGAGFPFWERLEGVGRVGVSLWDTGHDQPKEGAQAPSFIRHPFCRIIDVVRSNPYFGRTGYD